jgi:transcriptional regulator GlxA family with amidase domain
MNPSIRWAREEMERRLHEPCVLEHLAAAIGLPLAGFTRLFTKREGVAPAAYLHRLRLARAKVLLERTFLSVGQVMVLVGLNDAQRFEADFSQAYGVPPHVLREHAGGRGTHEG